MNADLLLQNRIVYTKNAFAELVLWRVPQPLAGSPHNFKYRLAYVVGGLCVLRYDNEAGKGDHRHYDAAEAAYTFTTVQALIAEFQTDIARWNDEHSHT